MDTAVSDWLARLRQDDHKLNPQVCGGRLYGQLIRYELSRVFQSKCRPRLIFGHFRQATISTNCNRIFQPKISKMHSLRMELKHFSHVKVPCPRARDDAATL